MADTSSRHHRGRDEDALIVAQLKTWAALARKPLLVVQWTGLHLTVGRGQMMARQYIPTAPANSSAQAFEKQTFVLGTVIFQCN